MEQHTLSTVTSLYVVYIQFAVFTAHWECHQCITTQCPNVTDLSLSITVTTARIPSIFQHTICKLLTHSPVAKGILFGLYIAKIFLDLVTRKGLRYMGNATAYYNICWYPMLWQQLKSPFLLYFCTSPVPSSCNPQTRYGI